MKANEKIAIELNPYPRKQFQKFKSILSRKKHYLEISFDLTEFNKCWLRT